MQIKPLTLLEIEHGARYRHLIHQIKTTATRRKYRNAFLKLAELLRARHQPIYHGGCNDDGEMCLYWDIGTHYCDIEVNPSCQSFSVYIRERQSPVRAGREWWHENVTFEDFEADWFARFLQPFKKAP